MEKAMHCCNQDDPERQASERSTPEGGPMRMGMGMGRANGMMGQCGSRMEMMRKRMAPMGGDDEPLRMQQMMQMCMGMCSEMLNGIRQRLPQWPRSPRPG
jgi:hypothetical protein